MAIYIHGGLWKAFQETVKARGVQKSENASRAVETFALNHVRKYGKKYGVVVPEDLRRARIRAGELPTTFSQQKARRDDQSTQKGAGSNLANLARKTRWRPLERGSSLLCQWVSRDKRPMPAGTKRHREEGRFVGSPG